MEKQEIKKCPKKQHPVLACIFYGAGILLILLMIYGLLFWRNPFVIPTVDAAAGEAFSEKRQEKGYVRITHMDLQFTGFYTVDAGGSISGYYYIGTIGDESWFVEVPADAGNTGLSQAMPDFQDFDFLAETAGASDVFEKASESEGLTVQEYLDRYEISDKILLAYNTHREADILCYVIALLAALGCFVAGRLFLNEA